MLALTEGLRRHRRHPQPTTPRRPPATGPNAQAERPGTPGRWFDEVLAGPAAWLHALRLAVCMAVAGVLSQFAAVRPVLLGVPDRRDRAQARLRLGVRAGHPARRRHAVGALLGAGILAFNPNGWVLVALLAVIGFLLPITQVRNFGMFSTVLTPLVILLLDLGRAGTWDLVLARAGGHPRRLCDRAGLRLPAVAGQQNAAGRRSTRRRDGAVSRLRRPRPAGRPARSVIAAPPHLSAALRPAHRVPAGARRAVRRRSAGAAAWYPSIVALERFTSSITKVAVEIDQGDPAPSTDDVDLVVASLRDIADAVRAQRRPADPPKLHSEQLAGTVAHIGAVVSALRGPELKD